MNTNKKFIIIYSCYSFYSCYSWLISYILVVVYQTAVDKYLPFCFCKLPLKKLLPSFLPFVCVPKVRVRVVRGKFFYTSSYALMLKRAPDAGAAGV
jgi:DNA-directed RNA polymerase